VSPTHTDTQATERAVTVAIDRIYAMRAMRPNNVPNARNGAVNSTRTITTGQSTEQTGVDSDAQSQRNVGHMSDPELAAFAENVQRHSADLADVPTAVAYRQTTAHHVRVSYRLHLPVSRIIAVLPTTYFVAEIHTSK